MIPKSRLYTLVQNWKNKPFQEVHDTNSPTLGSGTNNAVSLEADALWSKRQSISFEPIFNSSGSKLGGVLFNPLLHAEDSQVLRLFMDGLDAIQYWQSFSKPIPTILPIAAKTLCQPTQVDAISDLILNSRLPVGLVALGIMNLPSAPFWHDYQAGLARLRRIGLMLHLLYFSGSAQEIAHLDEMRFDGVHLSAQQLRTNRLEHQSIADLATVCKKHHGAIYVGGISLVSDLTAAQTLAATYCYGGLMMPPVSRHQLLQINDSRLAKAIFSVKPQ